MGDGFDLVSFILIVGLIAGTGWLMYWYAKKVGGGEARLAFEDPSDRKKVLIFWAGLIVFALIIFLGLLFFTDLIKL